MIEAGARCAVHTDQPAIDTCSRCGNFVCVGCMDVHDYETFCRACSARLGYRGQHSSRAIAALVCGLLPLFICCLPLGIPAVILGHMEMAAISAGTAPASGKNLALGGVILGWLSIATMVIGGIALLVGAFSLSDL